MAHKRDVSDDRAGVGPDPDRGGRLISIDRLDSFRFAEDEPDVRGWEVRTVGGRQLGDVKDLLVDPEAGEVVMLDIALASEDRRTLAPIRAAQIDRERRCVIMDSSDVDRALDDSRARREPRDERTDHAYEERDRSAAADRAGERGRGGAAEEEVVVERRPVEVEEVVVRRRPVDPDRDRLDEPDRDRIDRR